MPTYDVAGGVLTFTGNEALHLADRLVAFHRAIRPAGHWYKISSVEVPSWLMPRVFTALLLRGYHPRGYLTGKVVLPEADYAAAKIEDHHLAGLGWPNFRVSGLPFIFHSEPLSEEEITRIARSMRAIFGERQIVIPRVGSSKLTVIDLYKPDATTKGFANKTTLSTTMFAAERWREHIELVRQQERPDADATIMFDSGKGGRPM